MRNYYATLEIRRDAEMSELMPRLKELHSLEPEIIEIAQSVLLMEHRKQVYDQVHLQYEAIGLAFQAFKSEIANTNDWERRLVEFLPLED